MLKYNMNIFETVFYEKINIKKLNYIINNRSKYEAIITEQEKWDEEDSVFGLPKVKVTRFKIKKEKAAAAAEGAEGAAEGAAPGAAAPAAGATPAAGAKAPAGKAPAKEAGKAPAADAKKETKK